MKFRVFCVSFAVFLIEFIRNVESLQLYPNCGLSEKNSGGGLSFQARDSDRNEAPW